MELKDQTQYNHENDLTLILSSISATWLTEEAGGAPSGTFEEVRFQLSGFTLTTVKEKHQKSLQKSYTPNIPNIPNIPHPKVAWQSRCLELEESLSRFQLSKTVLKWKGVHQTKLN